MFPDKTMFERSGFLFYAIWLYLVTERERHQAANRLVSDTND